MGMTKSEQVLAVLSGEQPDVIPVISEGFMDTTAKRALIPSKTGDWFIDSVAAAELLKVNDITIEGGVKYRDLESTDDYSLCEYETGVQWIRKYAPVFNRTVVRYPVNSPEDVKALRFPDMHDSSRYEDLEQQVEACHRAGYLVQGYLGGMWAGSYDLVASLENILMWMAEEPEAAREIFDKIGTCILAGAEEMLKRNVDTILIADDLGTAQAPLFSPEMYRRFIKPWHRRLAQMCHSYGKYFHVHSHGHIQDLMDDIIDAGIDIIHPVGPSDHNDLDYFKEKWGDRITLVGAISTRITDMSEEEIEEHVAAVMSIGCRNGRFMPRTESGIPRMDLRKTDFFLNTLYKYRVEYGAGGRRSA